MRDVCADVEVPGLHVTAGAGKDRRVGEGLGRARQADLLRRCGRLRRHHAHDRHGGVRGGLPQRGVGRGPGADARIDAETEGGRHHRKSDEESGKNARRAQMLILDGGHDFARGIGRHHEAPDERRPCRRAKTDGTKTRVATVAHNRPPMTARPSGAFCSPPSPSPSAMGIMPMIMAKAVIRTGRNRVKPASMAALTGSPCCSNRSLAKQTTRILFAVPTPMHIMAPIKAGTLSVVCVRNKNPTMPASAAGSAVMMMKGSSQD